jgi:multidrug efflux pump subunit AcrA (membrane-fusion protein)
MKLFSTFTVCSLAAALLAPGALFAQAPNPEAQLREALRATTIQLRAAQGELAAANAEKELALADKTSLAKQLDALNRQAAADRAAAQANLANLNAQLAAKDAEATRLADKLKSALDTGDAAARLAQQRAEALTRNEIARVELERSVAELRTHNRELFHIGTEVLERYENFGLGKAIAAREPFTKLTRVKLQTLVQDYRDKLEDNRVKLPPAPDAPAATPEPAPAS